MDGIHTQFDGFELLNGAATGTVPPPSAPMNDAASLVQTLVDSGVNVCFGNTGTSEMHFVSALNRVPGMRSILGLFEGVVTGAADGYARMTGKPAATLPHLGPGSTGSPT